MSPTGKNLWLFIGLAALLIVAAVFLFFVIYNPEPVPAGILHPGAIFSGPDGVSLAAPEGALEHEVEVRIELVDDPRTEAPFPEFLDQVEVAGSFYEITASEDVSTPHGTYLLLGLPVPDGIPTDNLAIALLSPPGAIEYFSPEDKLFGTLFLYVGTLPQVVVLVETGGFMRVENAGVTLEEQNDHFSEHTAYRENSSPTDWNPPCRFPVAAGSLPGMLLLNTGALTQSSNPLVEQACTAVETARHSEAPAYNFELAGGYWLHDGFMIVCVGFAQLVECTISHRRITREALEEAYEIFSGLGFQEPRPLIVEIQFFPLPYTVVLSEYEYQLRRGTPNGGYNSLQAIGWTRYPGRPETPDPMITGHELFHAFQYGYENFYDNRLQRVFGLVEGTAVAAELSLAEFTRSNAQIVDSGGNVTNLADREPISINARLFQNTAAEPPTSASIDDYRTQDFWVYVGMRMNPVDQKVDFLIPFLERGGLLADIDMVLREEGTFESLADAYWQWAKNHSFPIFRIKLKRIAE